jgi:Domain of Unknown Function (DUF1080)
MKLSIITICAMLSITACGNVSTDNKIASEVISSEYIGINDTLVNFENDKEGQLPAGFSASATGKPKEIKWIVVNDKANKVTAQQALNSGSCFNLLVLDKVGYENFSASVNINAVSGREDQGGGLVWRYIDKDNYYIARYNPLENNVRLYRVVGGSRKQLANAESSIKQGEWFIMNIEMKKNRIICFLNGKKLIETTDETFKLPGLIGFWTKADAVTYFDNLKIHPDN